MLNALYRKWAVRHENRFNLALHAIGIPFTIAALPLLLLCSLRAAAALLIAGYALQFLGHAVEGNKSGEQMLLEKILRRRRT